MRSSTVSNLLFCLVLLASATQATERDEATAVRQARLEQNAAIARHDLDRIASFWTDDVTICRGLGAQLAGKGAYRRLFETDGAQGPDGIVYERLPGRIEVSPDWPLAFETGTWRGHRGTVTGDVVVDGEYSAQWVRRDGHWLIRAEVYVALHGSGPGKQFKATP